MGFRKDFLWGASTADFQIEGAWNADGKGPGIWDALSHEPGRIARGETGDTACDHYRRYKEDVALMKEIGLKTYRFSISWPRVMPAGSGRVNNKGLEFYSNLIDELLAAGIEPMMTLYHWNLPYELFKQGGWLNDKSSDWFANYTKVVVDALGDRVKYWLTFNEPQIHLFLGYIIGMHAPFEHYSEDQLLQMSRNILLAHGKAVQVIREALGDKAMISIAPTGDCFVPEDDSRQAIETAFQKSLELGHHFVFSNSWWADPIYFGRFADGAAERFGDRLFEFSDEEWALVSQPLDYFAYNVYQSTTVFREGREVNEQFEYPGCPKTAAGWCVTPEVLYWSSRFWSERYQKPVMITENGISLNDWVCEDGNVHDPQRIDFISRYLKMLRKSVEDGSDILGYSYWSLMDNLEWASGYDVRMGLIHVDYRDQKRTIKDSGYWYRDVILSNGENLT